MEVHLPFGSSHALSRKTLAAAGASSSARLLKAAAKVSAGCPSFGGQRTTASVRTQENTQRSPRHLPRSNETQSFKSGSLHQPQGLGASPERGSVQAPLPGRVRVQRWYASPFKYKARSRLGERGLTLPSSGPAFGGPLKSNVRSPNTPPSIQGAAKTARNPDLHGEASTHPQCIE